MNVRMLALCGVLGLGAGACVDNYSDSGLRILGNVAPGGQCDVDSSSTTFHDDGLIDANSPLGYVFTPSVINDLQTREGEPIGPKTIYVTAARVRISFYDPDFDDLPVDASLLRFQVPTSGAIEPNGGTAAYSFEVVPAELLAAIGARLPDPTTEKPLSRTTLDVSVQMVGSHGASEVVSNAFRYPIEVCDSCVLNDVGSCDTLPDGFVARTGGSCNVFQDGVIDCCDNFTVCPATPPATPN